MFDSRHVAQMRDHLRKKLKDGPTHVRRADVERVGGNMGLDPVEAARLFQSLEGAYWRGAYIVSNELGWIAAWVEKVLANSRRTNRSVSKTLTVGVLAFTI